MSESSIVQEEDHVVDSSTSTKEGSIQTLSLACPRVGVSRRMRGEA